MKKVLLTLLLMAVNVFGQGSLDRQIRQIVNAFSELNGNDKGALSGYISAALPFSIRSSSLSRNQADGLKGVISSALFEEVELPAIGRAAGLAAQVLLEGADVEAVIELSQITFSRDISAAVFSASVAAYAKLMKAGIPDDIYRQAVSYVMYNNWTPDNITGFTSGIIQAKSENVTLDKFTLAMIIRVDQGLGQVPVQQAVTEEIRYLKNLQPADDDRARRDEIYRIMTEAIAAGLPEFTAKDFYFNAVEEGWTAGQTRKMYGALKDGYFNGITVERLALAFIIRMEFDGSKVPVEQIISEETAYVQSLEARERSEKKLPPPDKPEPRKTEQEITVYGLNQSLLRQSIQSFIGVPYVWGGETRKGTDCSGFTKTVYYEQGIVIPRVSYQQYTVGTPVEQNKLVSGDLVFFNKSGWGRVSHVGIYVGEGNFAHSCCSKGVTISRLTKKYYRSRYAGAKRITT